MERTSKFKYFKIDFKAINGNEKSQQSYSETCNTNAFQFYLNVTFRII